MKSNMGFKLLSMFLLVAVASAANIYDGVGTGGQGSNPGVKLRITQKGLDYLNSVLLYEMNTIIPHLRLEDAEHSEGNGHIRITNGRVTGYKPPNSQSLKLYPPDQIVWSTSGANIAMAGHVQGSYGRFADEGDVDGYANDVSFTISIQPVRQGNGQFGAKTRSCTADIGALDFNIYNSGALGRMLERAKGPLINRMKPRIGQQLCKQATKIIDQAANEQLAQIPTKVPLNETAQHMFNKLNGESDDHSTSHGNSGTRSNNNNNRNKNNNHNDNGKRNGGGGKSNAQRRDLPEEPNSGDKSAEAQRELTKNITKHLMFDYSNMKDPSVQSRYLETYNKGEISYHGQGGTPFSPPPFHEPSIPTDRMVYAIASDYVANSMLYNAYSHGLLKTRISGDDTPDFKEYLKTTCDGDSLFEMCLGSIIPEMQESFPNSQAEINAEATKAPALFFRSDGTIDLMGQGLVKLIASKGSEKKTMAIANIDMAGKAKLFISDNKIKGNATIDKYEITMKENNLKGFDQDRLKEFTSSSKAMLQTIVNVYLKSGLRLPSMKAVKLVNPKLNVFERTARLDTDVEANKEELTKMAVKVIRKHGGTVDGY